MAASKNLTPQQRSLRASAAAHAMHSQNDVRETTAAGLKAFNNRFEREVDPDGTLDPAERARRAAHARRSYMQRLALKSARSRARSKGAA